jgi:hypothetical protein
MASRGSLGYKAVPHSETGSDIPNEKRSSKWFPVKATVASLICFIFVLLVASQLGLNPVNLNTNTDSASSVSPCPQYPPPSSRSEEQDQLERELKSTLESEGYLQQSVRRMEGAVNIATQSYDDMGLVGEDPRWGIFSEFHTYLQKTFPLMLVISDP